MMLQTAGSDAENTPALLIHFSPSLFIKFNLSLFNNFSATQDIV